MAEAEVGDHVLGDDPTAAALEERAAELLGKERALFFPSGTMANQTAIHLHARAGSDGLVMAGAHVLHYEEGAAAAWTGVQLKEVGSEYGVAETAEWREKLRPGSRYNPAVSVACLENTHNSGGGVILPVETMAEIASLAREGGVPVHLDGARLANAAAASDLPMSAWAEHADTVMIALSKGLGAPVGAMLAGTGAAMEVCWRIRRRFGGAMRQAGILAAAGLHALENNWHFLNADHERARRFAERIGSIAGLTCRPPDTNIVMIDIDAEAMTAADLAATLADRGVWLVPFGPQRLRAVFHLDVDDTGAERAADAIGEVMAAR